MTTVSIVTVTKENDAMNHEQNWIQSSVCSNFNHAKDKAFDWINQRAKANNAFHGSQPDATLQNAFVESHCGRFAASVQECEVDDR
jgi:hypothetical protein